MTLSWGCAREVVILSAAVNRLMAGWAPGRLMGRSMRWEAAVQSRPLHTAELIAAVRTRQWCRPRSAGYSQPHIRRMATPHHPWANTAYAP